MPASINATISHRDSHDNRFRRGRSIASHIPGLPKSLGLDTRKLARGPDKPIAVSHVCGQRS
jgi:hypothetical protein